MFDPLRRKLSLSPRISSQRCSDFFWLLSHGRGLGQSRSSKQMVQVQTHVLQSIWNCSPDKRATGMERRLSFESRRLCTSLGKDCSLSEWVLCCLLENHCWSLHRFQGVNVFSSWRLNFPYQLSTLVLYSQASVFHLRERSKRKRRNVHFFFKNKYLFYR